MLDSFKTVTKKGNFVNNAFKESFFKSLKTELIYGSELITKE